jgi:opacity protein-like surface antigen
VSLNFDAEYIRLSDDGSRTVTGPAGRATILGKLDVTSTLSILEGTAGYRVFDDQTTVDLLAGLRATRLNADLDLKGTLTVGDEVFGAKRSLNDTEDWVDGVVGARVLHPVSNEVSLFGYADLGGGGSDFTWQAVAGVNWEYSKGFIAKLGYRAIAWDYRHHGFVWDMRVHGPYAGLGIRF